VSTPAEKGTQEIVFGWRTAGGSTCSRTSSASGPSQIFREFEDADPELHRGRGDVKYHKGFSSDVTTSADGACTSRCASIPATSSS
jgi:2-oxoglutarate dehydrogenase E1 component